MFFKNDLNEVPEGISLEWIIFDANRMSVLNGTVVWSGRGYSGSDAGRVHPFDGLPKLFGLDLNEGKVQFRSRFIRNKVYTDTVKHQALPPLIQLNEGSTGRSHWQLHNALRYLALFRDSPVRATTTGALDVQEVHGRFLVGYDGPSYAVEIDLTSFETLSEFRSGIGLGITRLPTGAAAYAKSVDGKFYNQVVATDMSRLGRRATLCPFELMPDMKPRYFEEVELGRVVSIHNIAVTESYLLVILCPERHNLLKLIKTGSVLTSLEECPNEVNEFIVFDRYDGRLLHRIPTTYRFFFNHIISAKELGQQLEIDIIEIAKLENRINIPANGEERNSMLGSPVRYLVNQKSKIVKRIQLWEGVDCEMPYDKGPDEPAGFANYFQDTIQGQRSGICSIYEKRHWLPKDGWQVFSAPVLNKGLIMILTASPDFSKQRFVVLEAIDFSIVAVAEIPFRMGLVGHGTWFNTKT